MNPEQLARSQSEHAEQSALFCWANMAQKCGFEMADMMESYAHRIDEVSEGMFKNPIPELKWLHAIPNAGARGNKIAASQLKAEGVKAGVADVLWPFLKWQRNPSSPRNLLIDACGLYIELKRADGRLSDVSDEQNEFAAYVQSQGYEWHVAFGWRAAADIIKGYYTSGERSQFPR